MLSFDVSDTVLTPTLSRPPSRLFIRANRDDQTGHASDQHERDHVSILALTAFAQIVSHDHFHPYAGGRKRRHAIESGSTLPNAVQPTITVSLSCDSITMPPMSKRRHSAAWWAPNESCEESPCPTVASTGEGSSHPDGRSSSAADFLHPPNRQSRPCLGTCSPGRTP